MRFGLLGPVEVRQEGRLLSIGRGRERMILAALLLNVDRLTLTTRLIGVLWTEPPPSAKAQLHNLISSLRRRVGACDLIVSRPGGYELRLEGHEFDLFEFRRLVEQGRQCSKSGHPELAAAMLAEALSLWRGPALADVADEFVMETRQALHEERFAATEVMLDAELALGRYDDVLRELATLLVDHPYRERLHEIKMMALFGAGRRTDALAAYRRVYRSLVDDLGVEPGPSLRRLEQRILRGESAVPTHVVDRPMPRQLPPAEMVIGRDALIEEICAELRRTDSMGTPVVLVGPGGVGKTTVALTAAHSVADAFPDGQLYADLRGTQRTPAEPHAVLGRLLRSLGVDGADLPDDHDERIALYRSHLADRRMLVVLDDAASEEGVRPLLPGAATSTALVTSRRRLGALIGAARWTIPALTPGAALRLLARVIGAERAACEPNAAAAIVDLCGHLPLAVCIAAARLSVRPDWTLTELQRRLVEEQDRLDELAIGDLNVRASIVLSYRALDPPLRRLFRRLGLITAPDWPGWVAHELVGPRSETPIEQMIDQLVDIHLIEPLGRDAVGQMRFRLHDLVANFARERVVAEDEPADRAKASSLMLSGWLALATDADEHLEHDMIFASGLGAPAMPSGDVPSVRNGPSEWFETERISLITAVEQACLFGHADLAGKLALRLAGFLALRSYEDDREYMLCAATTCARAHGRNHLLVRLLSALFAMRAQRNQYAELPAIAEEELSVARQLGDPQSELQALNHAGRAARMLDRFAAAAEYLEQAVSRRARIPPKLRSRVLDALANVHADLGRPQQALPLLEEAIALQRAAGGTRTMAIHLRNYGVRLMDVGRFAEAEQTLEEALATARKIEDDRGLAWVEHARADLDVRRGRWAAAATRLDRSLQAHEQVEDHEGTAEVLRSFGDLAAGRNVPHEAVEPLRRSLRIWRRLGARLEQARILARLDRALLAIGDREAAAECHRECREILSDLELDESSLRLPPI